LHVRTATERRREQLPHDPERGVTLELTAAGRNDLETAR
jgi:hypothetical protein